MNVPRANLDPDGPQAEAGLHALLGGARLDVERRIDGAHAAPDVADVLRRAHQLAPGADHFPEPDASGTSALPFEPRVRGDDDLDAFLAAARPPVERAVSEAVASGRPPARYVAPGRRRIGWVVAGVSLAAAAAIVVAFFPWHADVSVRDEANTPGLAARVSDEQGPPPSVAPSRRAPTPPIKPRPAPEVVVQEPSAEPTPPPPARKRPAKQPERQKPPTFAERDREAQRLWRAGKVKEAKAAFRTIIRDDPGGRHAQTAYGELFSIARAQGNDRERLALWRAYLRRFPRGRFADDARAGLCRRTNGDAAAQCWDAYRRDFPRGAHAPSGAPR